LLFEKETGGKTQTLHGESFMTLKTKKGKGGLKAFGVP